MFLRLILERVEFDQASLFESEVDISDDIGAEFCGFDAILLFCVRVSLKLEIACGRSS